MSGIFFERFPQEEPQPYYYPDKDNVAREGGDSIAALPHGIERSQDFPYA